MDRQLTVEFPWLTLAKAALTDTTYALAYATDVRPIGGSDRLYVAEQKIDLSGYVQDSLTVGFRRSFEQKGAAEQMEWITYNGSTDFAIETVIISSVPFNDDQLTAACVGSPGFTNTPGLGLDWGNFNREHIIHGSYRIWYANSVTGSGVFTAEGSGTMVAVVDNYFSSLEPTASDCLYCYRVMFAPAAGATDRIGIKAVTYPPMRVILDAFTVEEPDLEYMMRLKRSYELANQV